MIRLLLGLLLVLLSAWPASAARQFNGTGDYLVSASTINLSAYTKGVWAAWIYADSYSNAGKYWFSFGGVSVGAFGLIADQASGVAEAFVNDGSGLSEFTFTRPSTGAWHHLVANVDWTQAANNKVTAVWVDGASQTLTNTSAAAGAGPFGNLTLTAGSFDGTTSFLPGREAEIAFWGGINFTQGDVNSLYNAGAGVVATSVQNASLKYYWQLCGISDSETVTTGGINLTVSGAANTYGPIGITHPISGTGICTGGVPTINAASCSQNNFASAINLASAGDTVTLPAGDCSWVGNVTTSKRLIIMGAGNGAGSTIGCGSCTTIIRDARAVDGAAASPQLFIWSPPNTGLSAMSGISWIGAGYGIGIPAGPNRSPQDGMIRIYGDGTNKTFRLHHMDISPYGTAGISTWSLMGLGDHLYFHLLDGGNGPANYTHNASYLGVGDYGDNSWAQASTMGTDQAMYWEDNNYITPPFCSFQFANDGWRGSRTVYRHNTYTNTQGGNGHGLDSGGRERSMRHHEVYNNTIIIENGQCDLTTFTGIRGGTGVHFNNSITVQAGGALSRYGDVAVDRADVDPSKWAYFSRCGKHTVNLTSSGTTATASSTSVNNLGFLVDSFHSQQLAVTGAAVGGYNINPAPVLGVPVANQVTYTTSGSGLAPSSGKVMSAWDGNTDDTGYPCMDQIGRGQGDLLTNYDATPVGWPNQALEPAYAWNNTLNGVDSPLVVGTAGTPPAAVEDRDFYNCVIGAPKTGCAAGTVGSPPGSPTPKAGYTPFTYPHPLQNAAIPSTFVPRHFIIRHRGP